MVHSKKVGFNMNKISIFIGVLLFILSSTMFAEQDKMRIAIMDLGASAVSPETAKMVSDLLRTELFNTGLFTVIERAEMEKILKEQGFQQSGCTENECAVQFGKMLSARKVLVGTVGKLGDSYIINARIVDVEKGVMEFAENTKVQSESDLDIGCKTFAIKLANRIKEESLNNSRLDNIPNNGMLVNKTLIKAPPQDNMNAISLDFTVINLGVDWWLTYIRMVNSKIGISAGAGIHLAISTAVGLKLGTSIRLVNFLYLNGEVGEMFNTAFDSYTIIGVSISFRFNHIGFKVGGEYNIGDYYLTKNYVDLLIGISTYF